jgi:hypothetical protein
MAQHKPKMWRATGPFNPRPGADRLATVLFRAEPTNARQPLVKHARPSRPRYRPLTRDFKRNATAFWQCRRDRAATARQGPCFSGRQMEAGGTAAGSSRAVRLDPFSLPVRFEAADEAADERRRVVDLFRERVVVRRCVGGMCMALNLPVSAFRGVAIRLKQRSTRRQAQSTSCSSMATRRCRCRFSLRKRGRNRGRVASLGPRAGAALVDRRARWQPARAVRASRRRVGGSAYAAAPSPQHDRTPPLFDAVATARGRVARNPYGA